MNGFDEWLQENYMNDHEEWMKLREAKAEQMEWIADQYEYEEEIKRDLLG